MVPVEWSGKSDVRVWKLAVLRMLAKVLGRPVDGITLPGSEARLEEALIASGIANLITGYERDNTALDALIDGLEQRYVPHMRGQDIGTRPALLVRRECMENAAYHDDFRGDFMDADFMGHPCDAYLHIVRSFYRRTDNIAIIFMAHSHRGFNGGYHTYKSYKEVVARFPSRSYSYNHVIVPEMFRTHAIQEYNGYNLGAFIHMNPFDTRSKTQPFTNHTFVVGRNVPLVEDFAKRVESATGRWRSITGWLRHEELWGKELLLASDAILEA